MVCHRLPPTGLYEPSCTTRSSAACNVRMQLADLVEEQGAAVGHRRTPPTWGRSAPVNAPPLVPEELAARQRRHDGGAVDEHQLTAPRARVEVVDQARHDLLARARLTGEQHRRRGEPGDLDDLAQHPLPAGRHPERHRTNRVGFHDRVHSRPPLQPRDQVVDTMLGGHSDDILGTVGQQLPGVGSGAGHQRDEHPATRRRGLQRVLGSGGIARNQDDTRLGGMACGTLAQAVGAEPGHDHGGRGPSARDREPRHGDRPVPECVRGTLQGIALCRL